MMRADEEPEERADWASDRRLWQRCRVTDAPEDEASRLLDLAAFADGLLDADEHDRIAASLAADPDMAADVQAARALRGTAPSSDGLEAVVAHASKIVPEPSIPGQTVVPFARRRRPRALMQHFAQWGSIAAAIALASWLGFSMGTDASLALSDRRQPSDGGFLPELFDPTTGFLRDLGEGLRT